MDREGVEEDPVPEAEVLLEELVDQLEHVHQLHDPVAQQVEGTATDAAQGDGDAPRKLP